MNKLWVVATDIGYYDHWEDYGETDIRLIGVFTSEEKAQQAIADEKFNIDDCTIVCVDVDKVAAKDDEELEQLFYQED